MQVDSTQVPLGSDSAPVHLQKHHWSLILPDLQNHKIKSFSVSKHGDFAMPSNSGFAL